MSTSFVLQNEHIERFEAKIHPEPNSGCHLWVGSCHPNGYGRFNVNGKVLGAHRVAYKIHCGTIPSGQQVLHHCDVPQCVNTDHLFLGTHAENMVDKHQKGRAAHGESHGLTTLTLIDIEVIRSNTNGMSQRRLGEQFGVSQATISRIQRGHTWSYGDIQ